jgi:signal transduction histidine kinase
VRRRLVVSTIAIVLVVLGTLAVPVGIVVLEAADKQLQANVEALANRIATRVNPQLAGGSGSDVDWTLVADEVLDPDSERLRVQDDNGEIVFESTGDPISEERIADRVLRNGDRVFVWSDADPLDDQVRAQLNLLVLLAIGAVIAAAGLAAVQAHQLARPLERLAARASRIGDGDFSRTPFELTDIPEIDRIGTALDTSAERVETMLANERHFTADATHQLRTGITGIAMRFEILALRPEPDVVTEAHAGLAQTELLNATIDELLAAARNRSTQERQPFDLSQLVNDHAAEWQPRFSAARRHISVITAAPAPVVFGTKGLAGQVIDILIDNTLKHGDGAVTLMIDGPSVVVIDQGKGMTPDRLRTVFDGPVDPAAKHGRGLALARRLAQVDGASLDVVGNQPLRIRYRLVRADPEPESGVKQAATSAANGTTGTHEASSGSSRWGADIPEVLG